MPRPGVWTNVRSQLRAGTSIVVPKGYHTGTGKVYAMNLATQTDASAYASDIAEGKTAWVRGQKLTGTGTIGGKATKLTINHQFIGAIVVCGLHCSEFQENGQATVTWSDVRLNEMITIIFTSDGMPGFIEDPSLTPVTAWTHSMVYEITGENPTLKLFY